MDNKVFNIVYFNDIDNSLSSKEKQPFVHVFGNFLGPITLMWQELTDKEKDNIIGLLVDIRNNYLSNNEFREAYISMYKEGILETMVYLKKLPDFIDKEKYSKIVCLSNQVENELKKCLKG